MRSSNPVLVVALIAWSSVQALAQQPPSPQGAVPVVTPPAAPQGGRGGPQGPVVVSPQVNADRTVTLRLLAPKATEVTVTGEMLNGEPAEADDQGRRRHLDGDARTAAAGYLYRTRSTSTA